MIASGSLRGAGDARRESAHPGANAVAWPHARSPAAAPGCAPLSPARPGGSPPRWWRSWSSVWRTAPSRSDRRHPARQRGQPGAHHQRSADRRGPVALPIALRRRRHGRGRASCPAAPSHSSCGSRYNNDIAAASAALADSWPATRPANRVLDRHAHRQPAGLRRTGRDGPGRQPRRPPGRCRVPARGSGLMHSTLLPARRRRCTSAESDGLDADRARRRELPVAGAAARRLILLVRAGRHGTAADPAYQPGVQRRSDHRAARRGASR